MHQYRSRSCSFPLIFLKSHYFSLRSFSLLLLQLDLNCSLSFLLHTSPESVEEAMILNRDRHRPSLLPDARDRNYFGRQLDLGNKAATLRHHGFRESWLGQCFGVGHEWNACAGVRDWKDAGRIQSVPFTDQYFKRPTFEVQTSLGTVPTN